MPGFSLANGHGGVLKDSLPQGPGKNRDSFHDFREQAFEQGFGSSSSMLFFQLQLTVRSDRPQIDSSVFNPLCLELSLGGSLSFTFTDTLTMRLSIEEKTLTIKQ